MIFQPGDLVWLHYRKDRFPDRRKSKLLPRGDGPFKVLERINDNAYKIELPEDDYGVRSTFNVADLSPFFGADDLVSRTTPFQEGEDDEGIPTTPSSPPPNAHDIRLELPTGPITRARAKKLQSQVNLLLNEYVIDFNENFILPKNSDLLVLRFEDLAMDRDQGYATVIQGRPSNEEIKALAYGPFGQGGEGQGPCGQARDQGPNGQAQSPCGGTRKEAQAHGMNSNRPVGVLELNLRKDCLIRGVS